MSHGRDRHTINYNTLRYQQNNGNTPISFPFLYSFPMSQPLVDYYSLINFITTFLQLTKIFIIFSPSHKIIKFVVEPTIYLCFAQSLIMIESISLFVLNFFFLVVYTILRLI